jgi:hypothetical protein
MSPHDRVSGCPQLPVRSAPFAGALRRSVGGQVYSARSWAISRHDPMSPRPADADRGPVRLAPAAAGVDPVGHATRTIALLAGVGVPVRVQTATARRVSRFDAYRPVRRGRVRRALGLQRGRDDRRRRPARRRARGRRAHTRRQSGSDPPGGGEPHHAVSRVASPAPWFISRPIVTPAVRAAFPAGSPDVVSRSRTHHLYAAPHRATTWRAG